MKKTELMKIITKNTSLNFWWGYYGLTEKIAWEDIRLFYETGEEIDMVCLNTKQYFRENIKELKEEEDCLELITAIENHLNDDKQNYWYYYDEKEDSDFKEVPYDAPINEKGIKPRSIEIWHTDEVLKLSTIKSAIEEFARQFLKIDKCQVLVEDIVSYEEAVESYMENKELFGNNEPMEIKFSAELISKLSKLWNTLEDNVMRRLNKGI